MTSSQSQRKDVDGSALAGFFSSAVVQEMARKGRSKTFSRLASESGIAAVLRSTDAVRDALDVAFTELSRSYRNEYVFKAAIAKKILLGRHSLNTAVMMTEFRVGACKADVVILNGTSTAYEIKSDRDKLDRLSAQVSTYLQAFARVNVVASERHVQRVLEQVPSAVGVMRLTRRGQLSPIRQPVDDAARVVPSTVFEALQQHEAKAILQGLGISVPDVPNTRMHRALRTIFTNLDATTVHDAMVATLRTTRSQRALTELLQAVPSSLHAAALTTRLRRSDHARLCAALNTRMVDALHWS